MVAFGAVVVVRIKTGIGGVGCRKLETMRRGDKIRTSDSKPYWPHCAETSMVSINPATKVNNKPELKVTR
jgi:hypothetical protein